MIKKDNEAQGNIKKSLDSYTCFAIANLYIDIELFIVLFLFMWFLNDLFNLLTPFLMVPILLIVFLGTLFKVLFTLITSIVTMIRFFIQRKISGLFCLLPVVAWLLFFMLMVNFNFTMTKIKFEHFLYQEKREQQIYDRLEQEIESEPIQDMLWKPFEEGEILAGYWVYQGMLSGYSILYYTSIDSPDIIEKYGGGAESEMSWINKIDDHWYYASFE